MARKRSRPDSLESAWEKLARANLHKGNARRETRRFYRRHPDPTFRIDPKGDEGFSFEVGVINHGSLVVDTAPPDLPLSFSARFGDAIQNYRCALDHVAWQLVLNGLAWPLPDELSRRRVQFPIYDTATSFRKQRDRRLPGVSKDVIDFIKARHQYVGGKATNNALLALAALSNDDKHRALHIFASLFKTLKSDVTFTRCRHLTWDNPPIRPALKKDAVLVNFSYVVTAPNPEVKVHLTPEAQIIIEDGRDFSEVLEGISIEVREILSAPEIIAAVT